MKPNEKAGMWIVIMTILVVAFICFACGFNHGTVEGCKGKGCNYNAYKFSYVSSIDSNKYLDGYYKKEEISRIGIDLIKNIGGNEHEKEEK